MALQISDRVKESTTTTGTGALTLGGAVTGYRAFSAVCSNNDTCYYAIEAVDVNGNPSGDWETGLGTYSGASQLTRTTVQASSNAGSAVNFGAGTKNVWIDVTATQAGAFMVGSNNLSEITAAATARTNLGLGSSATHASTDYLLTANNLSEVTAATAAHNLGLGSADAVTHASLTVTGQLTSQVATGTAPLAVTSTTQVTNLNASQLIGATWAAPAAIGSGTPAAGTFTTVSAGTGSFGTTSYQMSGSTNTGWYQGAAATRWVFSGNGAAVAQIQAGVLNMTNNAMFGWATGAADTTSVDTGMVRGGIANSIVFGGNLAGLGQGSATTRVAINKIVTAIADNTATTVFTVTVPNAAHSASARLVLKGSAGAGGAIGANEATRSIEYRIDITRTAGVNAVATISAAGMNPAAAIVVGGNGITVTGTLGAVSGAVGATNTFTIQATVARAASTATNHTCFANLELLNDNASGVTVA